MVRKYVIAVAIVREKKKGGKMKTRAMLFRALSTDFINDYMRPCYKREWRDYSPKTIVFLCRTARLQSQRPAGVLEEGQILEMHNLWL
ncbi:hypothetical protein CW713_06635 [Methanophagales archaeon]|nr:MAG: hypothetical protein CW713_06635 [Methanophagales archaeon]